MSNAKAGDTVELKDKETGFTDPDTGWDISRDQRVKLTDPIGDRTNRAIMSGGLLVVGSAPKHVDDDEGPGDDYDLPADLPGREAFVAAGLVTFAAVKELDTEEKLLGVAGIGKGTVAKIAEWQKANPPQE